MIGDSLTPEQREQALALGASLAPPTPHEIALLRPLWAAALRNIAAHQPLDPATIAAVAPHVAGLAEGIQRREVLTAQEVAERWQVSTKSVHRRAHNVAVNGHDPTRLNGFKVGRFWRFKAAEVQRFETGPPRVASPREEFDERARKMGIHPATAARLMGKRRP